MKQLFVRKLLIVGLLLGIASPGLATDAFTHPGPYVGLGMAGGFSALGVQHATLVRAQASTSAVAIASMTMSPSKR